MEKKTKKSTGVRIDTDLIKQVKHLAVDMDRSFSSLMNEAVQDLVRKYSQPKKK